MKRLWVVLFLIWPFCASAQECVQKGFVETWRTLSLPAGKAGVLAQMEVLDEASWPLDVNIVLVALKTRFSQVPPDRFTHLNGRTKVKVSQECTRQGCGDLPSKEWQNLDHKMVILEEISEGWHLRILPCQTRHSGLLTSEDIDLIRQIGLGRF